MKPIVIAYWNGYEWNTELLHEDMAYFVKKLVYPTIKEVKEGL